MTKKTSKNYWRDKLNLSRLAIKYSWLTICIWIAISVAGLFAFSSLKYALFPDITFPVVVVQTDAKIDTAIDTENQLTLPLENSLKTLEHLDEITASSYPGQGIVTLYFDPGINLKQATNNVENTLKNVNLPANSNYQVIPFNLNESTVISYVFQGNNQSLRDLVTITEEKIIPEITKIKGVLKVNILGNDNPSNYSDFVTLVRFNGENSIAFEVIKESNANTLEVVKNVSQSVDNIKKSLPNLKLSLAQTDADYIQEATQSTIDSLLLAIVLAVAIIFPFLGNFKATLITALAIPTSLFATFIVMAISGFNLETITLLALALVIGIIVDDAIVEVENISRHLELGKSPKTAALLATREIGLTVSASTFSIVAVFLPVALMGGTIGQFFKPFGLTVSASVIASLLVARTLSPVLAIYWLKVKKKEPENRPQKENFWSKFSLEKPYRNFLHWSLNHRKSVVIIALISFIMGLGLIPFIPQGFIPQLDRGEFNLVYTTPLPKLSKNLDTKEVKKPEETNQNNEFSWLNQLSQTPEKLLLRKTRQIGEKLEEIVLNIPEVETAYNIAGRKGDPTKGVIYIKLKKDRQLTTFEIQAKIRQNLPQLKGVTTSVEDLQFVETESEKPLQIALLGTNINELITTATKVKNEVEKLIGFADVTISGQELNENISFGIERLNGQRVIYISANLESGKSIGDGTEEVIKLTQSLLPNNIQLERWGNSAQSDTVLTSFGKTLILSVLFMLLFLVIPFGRLLEPLVVGLSLPLSIVGAMLALLITQSDFGMISLIGLIFLLGLLDKNAILLMDCANQLRQKGIPREEALIETGIIRLRPILMTTLSTILGMLPIALGMGAGAELRQPMAVAIIGGLTTSSLLSLIVVPVLYTLVEDGWNKLKNWRNKAL